MRCRLLRFTLPVIAFLAVCTLPGSAAVARNRITSAITGNSRTPLERTIPVRALRSADLGLAPANRNLTGLSLRFSMTDAQQAELTQLLSDQQNPGSPLYHQWLTPEQFG
ncbi:MAG: protease pro-enzyme activation domain-containing protein, partial [Edaphobacter sp.]